MVDGPGNYAPPQAPYGAPPLGPPPKKGTNGLSIAGLILAFLIPLVGLILSIVGLIMAGKNQQKGKGLAIAGIIVSLVIMIGATTLIISTVGKNAGTLADPGCTIGKAAVLDNESKVNNEATFKEGMQATIAGLDNAASKAKHDNVRNVMTTLSGDYKKVLDGVDNGQAPTEADTKKMSDDGAAMDALCTLGGAK